MLENLNGILGKAGEKSLEGEKEEVVIDLQKKLSKLEFSDVDFIYNLLLEKQYRGSEIERATTVLLKIRFIRNQLQENTNAESSEIEDG